MPITFAKPPGKSNKALQKGLTRHRAVFFAAKSAKSKRQDRPAEPRVLLPHIVYFARLNHVKAGTGLRYARPVVWRYFVESPKDKSLALAETTIEKKGRHRFASLHTVAQAGDHFELLNSIAEQAGQRGSYAFRLLRIPSIYVLAIWLRGKRSGKDLIVPLASNHHFLKDRHFYPRQEFEKLIQAEAKSH